MWFVFQKTFEWLKPFCLGIWVQPTFPTLGKFYRTPERASVFHGGPISIDCYSLGRNVVEGLPQTSLTKNHSLVLQHQHNRKKNIRREYKNAADDFFQSNKVENESTGPST